MKTAARHLMFLSVLLFTCTLCSVVWAQNNCKMPGKQSQLAMDQRDDERLKCMKQKMGSLKVQECLDIAKAMEFSNNAEDARVSCLYDLKKRPTLKECVMISKAMEYPDTGDQARWECIRRFNRVITVKQCQGLAGAMSYPGNTERAQVYCKNELQ